MTSLKVRLCIYAMILGSLLYIIRPYSKSEIESAVKPHYIEFMSLVTQYCKEDQYFHPHFKIQFRHLPNSIIGLCSIYPRSFIVYFDKKFWDDNEDLARFQLVAHELSHCILGLEHVKDPYNYMAPSFINISKKELYNQIKEVLKRKCSK